MAQLNFFQHFILCRNFYIFAWGGLPTFHMQLHRFVISILQKMLWINCSPTMVDCGPSIKSHCANNRGAVHRTEAPSVNFFFSPETNPMLWEGSQWETNHFTGMDMIPVCNLEARKSTKIVSTIVRRENSLYWPGNKIMVRDLLGGTWQYKWAT